MSNPDNVLGVAASFNKMSFVFFRRRDLGDWGNSHKGVEGLDAAFGLATTWFRHYKPSILVVPEYGERSRKGRTARSLIEAVAAAADEAGVEVVRMERPRTHANKHKEAVALADRYRQIEGWVPKHRRAWEDEPRTSLMFEALAVTHAYLTRKRHDAYAESVGP